MATSAYGSAENNLSSRISAAIRTEFGKLPLTDLVSGQRVNVMEKIKDLASKKAASLGIKVIDVRIKQRTIILATAKEKAAQTIADGQAQAAQIYADAYQNDPKFYQFYRSLEAYKNVFTTKDDTIVLHPKGEFFKYFNTPLMSGVSK